MLRHESASVAGEATSEVANEDRRAGAVRGSPCPEGVRPNTVRTGGGGCALVLASSGTACDEEAEARVTEETASSMTPMT